MPKADRNSAGGCVESILRQRRQEFGPHLRFKTQYGTGLILAVPNVDLGALDSRLYTLAIGGTVTALDPICAHHGERSTSVRGDSLCQRVELGGATVQMGDLARSYIRYESDINGSSTRLDGECRMACGR